MLIFKISIMHNRRMRHIRRGTPREGGTRRRKQTAGAVNNFKSGGADKR